MNNENTHISAHFKASDMDDSDVYFLNKFGHVALQQQQIDLANAIFQRVNQFHFNFNIFNSGAIDWNTKWKMSLPIANVDLQPTPLFVRMQETDDWNRKPIDFVRFAFKRMLLRMIYNENTVWFNRVEEKYLFIIALEHSFRLTVEFHNELHLFETNCKW